MCSPMKDHLMSPRRKLGEGASLPSEGEVMDEAVTEEVLLDENMLAKGGKSFDLGGFEVSALAP